MPPPILPKKLCQSYFLHRTSGIIRRKCTRKRTDTQAVFPLPCLFFFSQSRNAIPPKSIRIHAANPRRTTDGTSLRTGVCVPRSHVFHVKHYSDAAVKTASKQAFQTDIHLDG